MSFFQVLVYWLIAYAVYYGGMITYDLVFNKTSPSLYVGSEDEDIDVSEEVRGFNANFVQSEKIVISDNRSRNTIIAEAKADGGYQIDDLQASLNKEQNSASLPDDLSFLCEEVQNFNYSAM